MEDPQKLWTGLTIVVILSFVVLGYYGSEIYREAPPVPEKVVTTEGKVVFTGLMINNGKSVWQSTGGQQLGSIWGHGAYNAPDWSAYGLVENEPDLASFEHGYWYARSAEYM